jgi:hypothetical protein
MRKYANQITLLLSAGFNSIFLIYAIFKHFQTLSIKNTLSFKPNMGVVLSFVPGKMFELLFFITIAITAGIFFILITNPAISAFLKNKIRKAITVLEKKRENTVTFLILFFILPLTFLLYTQIIFLANFYLLYQIIFSISFFYVIAFNPDLINKTTSLINKINPKYFGIGIIIISVFIVTFVFHPYFTGKPYIASEYYNLSGKTILNKDRVVDTKSELQKYIIELQREKNNPKSDILEKAGHFESQNRFFLGWIFLNRWIIHHHNFILTPINQIECGDNYDQVCALYGTLSAAVFHEIMEHTTGINIQGWLRINYSSFIIYLLLCIISLLLIFKNFTIPALFCISYLICLQCDFIISCILGPGSAPWRNFFDIFTLLFIVLYFRERKTIFLSFIGISIIASIIMNNEIGIMISAAAISVLSFDALKSGRIKKTFSLIFSMITIISAIYILTPKNSAGFSEYFKKGLLGWDNANQYIIFFAVIVAIVYYILYRMNKESHYLFYPVLYLFIYAQILQTYYIWHYNTTGFISRSYIYFFTISLLFLYIFEKIIHSKKSHFPVVIILIALTFSALLSFPRLQRDLKYISNNEKNHVTYVWNFDRASIRSSMDPAPIQSAINSINSHSTDSGIYIISNFDNLLPFLAKKTSRMPFFDMKWFIITNKEMQQSINKIKNDKPEYLYVDSDIEDDKQNQIIPKDTPFFGGMNQESIWRVERETLLKKLFQSVKSNYKLIEKGELISVYKRK